MTGADQVLERAVTLGPLPCSCCTNEIPEGRPRLVLWDGSGKFAFAYCEVCEPWIMAECGPLDLATLTSPPTPPGT